MTRELLDEVLAHPDDAGPRRVYADWLSERDGDVAAIASSQLARGLEHLDISIGYRDLGEATIEAFSRSKRLGKLQHFGLRCLTRKASLVPLEKRWGSKLVVRS